MVTLISRASIMRYPVVSYPIIGEFPNLSTVSSQNVYILRKEQGTPRFWRSLLEKCCQKLVAAQVSGLVALGVHTELIVVAGQDGVEDHARQGGDGQAGQGDVCAAHGEGDAAGGAEAQAADEDHRRDDDSAVSALS